ncbi:protein-arginine deiminase type-3-like [Pleurodeles waltl]|uniref:protein-arginine deiminase type-3-like n=1 Tax=Pleurodeles waltl TaxID=8319 RepID=UPI00370964B3
MALLANTTRSHNLNIISYANDTQLILSLTKDSSKTSLHEGMKAITKWMKNSCLKLNSEKTEVLIFGSTPSPLDDSWWPATLGNSWTWGPDGHGAVLLVNCDRDKTNSKVMDSMDESTPNPEDIKDMSPMLLRSRAPDAIFENYSLALHISHEDADKVTVFQKHGCGVESMASGYQHVLGGDTEYYEVRCVGEEETTFYVEGLAFPDVHFSGLVSIHLTLQKKDDEVSSDAPIFTDEVVFRMAPWIMTPNTLKPLEVFVCSLPDNSLFLEEVNSFVKKAKCKLTICSLMDSRGDRWIQDEMEFGYIEAPQKSFPVLFDSPRNGPLENFPFRKILGPDFGYVTREPEDPFDVSTLDSFGNLEVCPPVTVDGKEYPLGRILIGGHCPTSGGLQMTKVVRDFLHAQQVQKPLELWSDWLHVAHVDEFLTFVPAPDRKGFRLLLASTTACYQLFQQKKEEGYGDAVMFQGLKVKTFTINQILSNKNLEKESKHVQSCIDLNRALLKEELGLVEEDLIDIPALFKLGNSGLASAFFPDMVNMLVLGKHLGIPKPFGPIIRGKCCLEENVRSLLEPLGLQCSFINDFSCYHQLMGEVHCGTNVRRTPFNFKWWNMAL